MLALWILGAQHASALGGEGGYLPGLDKLRWAWARLKFSVQSILNAFARNQSEVTNLSLVHAQDISCMHACSCQDGEAREAPGCDLVVSSHHHALYTDFHDV